MNQHTHAHTQKRNSLVTPADYLEAVEAHPAIGDKQALRDKFAPSRSGWEGAEQAAAAGASEVGYRWWDFLIRHLGGEGERGVVVVKGVESSKHCMLWTSVGVTFLFVVGFDHPITSPNSLPIPVPPPC